MVAKVECCCGDFWNLTPCHSMNKRWMRIGFVFDWLSNFDVVFDFWVRAVEGDRRSSKGRVGLGIIQ